jgi:hypothetical protein
MNATPSRKDGSYYVMLMLEYICHTAEGNLTFDELYAMTQEHLGDRGELMLMTIATCLRAEGRKEGFEQGLEKGTLMGEILFAQKMLKLTIYSQEELETKSLADLKEILTKMEAQLQIRE